uniref:Lipocalin n=1 Tax=Meloidogyne floridensis TaxID=298350 RepID=A0A915NIJ9_9BILA
MQRCLIYFLAFLATLSNVRCALKTADLHCMFLGYPDLEYDGFDRTETVSLISMNVSFSCLLRHVSENYSAIIKKFLSHSKQIMTKRGYNFYTVNTTKEIRLRNQEEVEKGEDTIHVYKDGYKIEYNGVRGKER